MIHSAGLAQLLPVCSPLTAPVSAFTVCIDVSSQPVNYGNNSSFFAHPLWIDCKPSRLQLIYLPNRLNGIHCSIYVLYGVFAFALLCVGVFSAIVIHDIRNILQLKKIQADIFFIHTPPLTACGVKFADS